MEIYDFYATKLWFVFIILAGCLPICAYLGHFVGKRTHKRNIEEISNFIPTTILGLLALLLGFTFSMSVSRYDGRQTLVLTEANSIGTTYLRADFLPAPHGENVKRLLREYLNVRIKVLAPESESEPHDKISSETQRLQNLIWQESVAAEKINSSPMMASFIESLNATIDLSSTWDFVLMNRVPELVYIMIMIVSFVGIFSLGYMNGSGGAHARMGMIILSILFAAVIALIQDLDRPRRGLIRVSQASLLSLKAQLEKKSGN